MKRSDSICPSLIERKRITLRECSTFYGRSLLLFEMSLYQQITLRGRSEEDWDVADSCEFLTLLERTLDLYPESGSEEEEQKRISRPFSFRCYDLVICSSMLLCVFRRLFLCSTFCSLSITSSRLVVWSRFYMRAALEMLLFSSFLVSWNPCILVFATAIILRLLSSHQRLSFFVSCCLFPVTFVCNYCFQSLVFLSILYVYPRLHDDEHSWETGKGRSD